MKRKLLSSVQVRTRGRHYVQLQNRKVKRNFYLRWLIIEDDEPQWKNCKRLIINGLQVQEKGEDDDDNYDDYDDDDDGVGRKKEGSWNFYEKTTISNCCVLVSLLLSLIVLILQNDIRTNRTVLANLCNKKKTTDAVVVNGDGWERSYCTLFS